MKFKLKNNCLALIFIFVFSLFTFGQTKTEADLKWYDLRDFTIEGKGWSDTAQFYDRLPARAQKLVRPEVWRLAQNSAGISARFITDADAVSIRWKLRSTNLALPNMTATAVSGVDLYVRENSEWRWAASGRANTSTVSEQKIIGNMTRRSREFLLYLPLYNGVESVEIGLPVNASAAAAPPFPKNIKPIVFYGTSIVQGASASRAGMAYPAILGRRLKRPVINLGFSGNGRMEAEVAELLTEIDAAVYVIDCLPNLSSDAEVTDKTPKLIEILRRKRPAVPIILVENIEYPDVWLEERKKRIYLEKNTALRKVYKNLLAGKVKKIYYISNDSLIGSDSEGTVDGVHPNDLGFFRMANIFQDVLKKILDD